MPTRRPRAWLAAPCFVSLAHGLCATTSAPSTSLYGPFVDRALSIFDEAGLRLSSYPLDESLTRHTATTGPKSRPARVDLSVRAYCTDELRQARLVLIEGGSGLQVLNFCIFPELTYGLPSFSADLVTLPGGHLIAMDFAPNSDVAADAAFARDGALAACFSRHRDALPDGGPLPEAATRYFSPYFLWSRLPLDEAAGGATVASTVLAAFDDYLRTYLRLVEQATPLESDDALGSVREAQLAYSTYRAESDPARPMLTRLFGADYAERLIREVLFDLPTLLQAAEDEPR
jgi:phycoerythrobilin:ferredoxin oxidoreductase